ncbi:class I SAM-dependent methyltransferase [Burkholderia sp. RS01]|uniref:class I SAM-dependent methyltransferase n=1 Tax=Bacteria TaxID=2 RepID=UPI001C8F7330|nr:class I SAM-dependent methyltransferase [Arthrobacter sp. KBS0703]
MMGIEFTSPRNRNTYATRIADTSWKQAVTTLMDPRGLRVADVGCGGGIYSTAWLDLGADSVIGIDSSEQMIGAAQDRAGEHPNLSFRVAEAARTGLPAGQYDVVFQRALIHHLPDTQPAFEEAHRILSPRGSLMVQDRTMSDILQPGSAQHLRGYFFEVFPGLIAFESSRRPEVESVTASMGAAGFATVSTRTISERRRAYASFDALRSDLKARTGRSILHELTDAELNTLIDFISTKIDRSGVINEVDYWTIWMAGKAS